MIHSQESPLAVLPSPVPVPDISSVKRSAIFNYFGPTQPSPLTAAAKFLASLTDVPEQQASHSLDAFLQSTHAACIGNATEKSACWLTIRLTQPNNFFKVPRWHQDGRMFDYDEARKDIVRSKYALTLLGPPTLMLPTDQKTFDTLRRGEDIYFWWKRKAGSNYTEEKWESANEELRGWLADEFATEERVRLQQGDVVRFSWGRDDSPLHSEPDLVSDRVFITVLYGSEGELQRMCEWRGAEYGRIEG